MNDEKIIQAIRSGSGEAIQTVMNAYAKLVWSVAGAVLGQAASIQDVEECVADVFIYLWQNPDKFDPQRGKLKTWLALVARSQAIDRYRVLTRQMETPLEDAVLAGTAGIVDGILAQEDRQRLRQELLTLPEQDREILLRRYYYAQKPKEIALAMGLPVKGVENHLYRTKQRLRRRMTEEKEVTE